jgi:hypothetical protein
MLQDPAVKHLMELRYTPLPGILDKRGQIADALMDDLFDSWRINKNRVDVFSKENKNIGRFLSYTNLGLGSETPNTSALFIEKAKELIKKAWTFTHPQRYSRFGVRTIFYIPQEKSITSLLNLYRKNFLSLSTDQIAAFEGKLIDVGFPLNFVEEDEKTKFNVVTGAMKKEQALEFFNNNDLLSDVGIFIDVDYFVELAPDVLKQQRQYFEFIQKGVDKATSIKKEILQLLKIE